MRIVLTVHQFLPEFSTGTEIITLGIARELLRRGHDVVVFTGYPAKVSLDDDKRFDSYTYEEIPVERFLHAHVPMGGQCNIVQAEYDNRLFHAAFTRFLRKFQPDIVHFIHLGRLSASAIDACRELGIATCFTATDFWLICPTNQLRLPDNSLCTGPDPMATNCVRHLAAISQSAQMQKRLSMAPDWMLRLATWAIRRDMVGKSSSAAQWVKAMAARPGHLRERMNEIDRVFVPSKIMGQMLVRNGLEPGRMRHLPYGIELKNLTRNTKRGQRPTLRLGFIGTLYEHKGCHIVIQAVRSLPPEMSVELWIYGKMEEFPAYVGTLRELAADDPRIAFKGSFHNTQVGKILSELDLIVCASIWYENTPLVIYEAMAAGCPVLASNLGGMAESVADGENGMLFEAGNAGQLASHIQTLYNDRAMLKRLAEHTRPPLSVPDHVTELEKAYRELAPQRSSEPAEVSVA